MRRATIRTTHDEPGTVAAAVAPDNTDEMDTRVEDDRVVTEIERATTGSLASTVDDYVVNLSVAERAVDSTDQTDEQHADQSNTDQP